MKFAAEMANLAVSCAGLSERTRLVNVLSVFLSYHSCILETVINGDSSKAHFPFDTDPFCRSN